MAWPSRSTAPAGGKAFKAAKDYSRGGFGAGTRLAHAIVNAPEGPSLFARPGEGSTAALAVKLAQHVLEHGKRVKADAEAQRQADYQRQVDDANLTHLRNLNNPSYMTQAERERLDIEHQNANTSATRAANGGQPRLVHLLAPEASKLGLGRTEGDYDLNAAHIAATLRGQDVTRSDKLTPTPEGPGAQKTRLMTGSQKALGDLDKLRTKAMDAAEHTTSAHLDSLHNEIVKNPINNHAKALMRELGVDPAYYQPGKRGTDPFGAARAEHIRQARLDAGKQFDSDNAADYSRHRAIVAASGDTTGLSTPTRGTAAGPATGRSGSAPVDGSGPSPAAQKIINGMFGPSPSPSAVAH